MASRRPKILRLNQVVEQVGKSPSGIYQAIKDKKFPRQVKLGSRAVGWLESEIFEWIEARVRESREDHPTAPPREGAV